MVAEAAEAEDWAATVDNLPPGSDVRFWQLFLAAELGKEKSRELLASLGASRDPVAALLSWPKLTQDQKNRLELSDDQKLSKLVASGVGVLTLPDMPETLARVPTPPTALFTWGDTGCLHGPKIAIVGTRTCTTYGEAAATKFAEYFASCGVTVVSGGAHGIDGAAHRGAIQGGGKTAAVLGHGIDKVYPSSHTSLFQQIRANGCLVSQFAVGKPHLAPNFLLRNQVVASLADAVVVVEAPERSGAISTASHAANLCREVFVVPGNITITNFRGSHQLIRDGATLVDHPEQVMETMGWESEPIIAGDSSGLNLFQSQIIEAIGGDTVSVEKLSQTTGMSASDLMAELTVLEIEGIVVRDGAGYLVKP